MGYTHSPRDGVVKDLSLISADLLDKKDPANNGPDSGSSGESEATMAEATTGARRVDERYARIGGLADLCVEAGLVDEKGALEFVLDLYREAGKSTKGLNRGTKSNSEIRRKVEALLLAAQPSAGESDDEDSVELFEAELDADSGPPTQEVDISGLAALPDLADADALPDAIEVAAVTADPEAGEPMPTMSLEEARSRVKAAVIEVRAARQFALEALQKLPNDRTPDERRLTRFFHTNADDLRNLVRGLGLRVPRRDNLSDEEVLAGMELASGENKPWLDRITTRLIMNEASVDEIMSDFEWPHSPRTRVSRTNEVESNPIKLPPPVDPTVHPRYSELNAEQIKLLDAVLAVRAALADVQQAALDEDSSLTEREERLLDVQQRAHSTFVSAVRATSRKKLRTRHHRWLDWVIAEGQDIVVLILECKQLKSKPTPTNSSSHEETAQSDRHVVTSGALPAAGRKVSSSDVSVKRGEPAESRPAERADDSVPAKRSTPEQVVMAFTDEQLIELVGSAEVDRIFDEIYQRFDYSEGSPDMEAIEAEVRGMLTARAREATTQVV